METKSSGCCCLGSCSKTTTPDLPELNPLEDIQIQKKQVIKSEGGVSSFVKGGIGLMVPATVDMIIAFVTSYWATYSKQNAGITGGYGLWKVWNCVVRTSDDALEEGESLSKNGEGLLCHEKWASTTFPAWHIAMQVMMTISLASMLCAFIMLLLYIFWSRWRRSKKIMSTIISMSYFSGLNLLVSLCVFGFKASEEIEMMNPTEWLLSWSFSLACTAFVMNQISASILITENKRLRWDWEEDGGKYMQLDNDNDLGALPTLLPEPRRAVFAPENSVKVKDLRIGPPPKKSKAPLVDTELETIVEESLDC